MFFLLKIDGYMLGYEVVLILVDVLILVNSALYPKVCVLVDISVTALYGLRPSYYSGNWLLTDTEAKDVLEVGCFGRGQSGHATQPTAMQTQPLFYQGQ